MRYRKKTAEDFRQQAIRLNLGYWEHHTCAVCGCPVGYYFFRWPGYEVVFDSGCGCSRRENIHPSSWEEVADHYNMQKNPEVIEEMDRFWRWKH